MKERAERTTSPDAKDLLGRWALDLGGRVAPEIEHGGFDLCPKSPAFFDASLCLKGTSASQQDGVKDEVPGADEASLEATPAATAVGFRRSDQGTGRVRIRHQ